jgi:hypothetical protein
MKRAPQHLLRQHLRPILAVLAQDALPPVEQWGTFELALEGPEDGNPFLDAAPPAGIGPVDKWQNPEFGGRVPDYYLVYFGRQTPRSWPFARPKAQLQDGFRYRAEGLDTWDMTLAPVEGEFVVAKGDDNSFADTAGRAIDLPGRPGMAIRIRRVE